jgi:hypothetical protein
MSPTNRHWHIATGEQYTPFFKLIKFDEQFRAIDFFLNMATDTFKSIDKKDRADLEYRMFDALSNSSTMLFDGGNKYIMIIFGCSESDCMISTMN